MKLNWIETEEELISTEFRIVAARRHYDVRLNGVDHEGYLKETLSMDIDDDAFRELKRRYWSK